MKTIKTLLATIAVLLCSTTLEAETVQIEGIWYNLSDYSDLASVTSSTDGTKYAGTVIIPSAVEYNNKTYTTTLTIDKIPTTVTATVDDITYTENTIINVKGGVDGIAIVNNCTMIDALI